MTQMTMTPTTISERNSPRRSRVVLVWVLILIVTAATALALWSWFSAPNTAKYEPVLRQITAKQLDATNGRIDLSQVFPGLVARDEVFISRRPDDTFLAFFPTYYGKGISIGGLMYTSRPLVPQDTYVRQYASTLDRRMIDVAAWRGLSIDGRVNEHWYKVSRGVR